MAKVLVLYYSSFGHMEAMARAAAEGARAAGAEVTIKRVPELVPEEVAAKSGYKLDQQASIATPAELTDYDGFVFGVPSENFTKMLLVPALLRRVGLEEAAQEYGNWFNAHSQHFHTDAPEVWVERLTRHGFKVEHHEYYIDEPAHQRF